MARSNIDRTLRFDRRHGMQSRRSSVYWLGESGQRIREHAVARRSRVLVHEGGTGAGMAHPAHQLFLLAPVDAAKVFPVCLKS